MAIDNPKRSRPKRNRPKRNRHEQKNCKEFSAYMSMRRLSIAESVTITDVEQEMINSDQTNVRTKKYEDLVKSLEEIDDLASAKHLDAKLLQQAGKLGNGTERNVESKKARKEDEEKLLSYLSSVAAILPSVSEHAKVKKRLLVQLHELDKSGEEKEFTETYQQLLGDFHEQLDKSLQEFKISSEELNKSEFKISLREFKKSVLLEEFLKPNKSGEAVKQVWRGFIDSNGIMLCGIGSLTSSFELPNAIYLVDALLSKEIQSSGLSLNEPCERAIVATTGEMELVQLLLPGSPDRKRRRAFSVLVLQSSIHTEKTAREVPLHQGYSSYVEVVLFEANTHLPQATAPSSQATAPSSQATAPSSHAKMASPSHTTVTSPSHTRMPSSNQRNRNDENCVEKVAEGISFSLASLGKVGKVVESTGEVFGIFQPKIKVSWLL